MSISVLVVLYNSALDDVPVLKTALSSRGVEEIIVCDNSDRENDNAKQAALRGVTYVSMGGNKGLSKAYNAGVKCCHSDIVCIFDDDTQVDELYFNAVSDLANSSRQWDIALPIVMSGGKVLSPSHFENHRTLPVEPARIGNKANLTGINSGMVVKRALYDHVLYDTNLFLDLIDHQFILDARKAGARIILLKGPVLQQSYSLETDSYDGAKIRLKIFEQDAKHFYSKKFSSRLYCQIMLLGRKIKMCIRYKTLIFL